MSFQPVIPLTGYAGWTFLTRTQESQTQAFLQSAVIERDSDYFRANIAQVQSAEDLVEDRRLLEVSLTAFGLADDLDSRAFVQTVLEEGAIDPESLANRLADPRYLAFTKAFGFGDLGVPNTQLSEFPDEILGFYEARLFEEAVGTQDDSFRIGLNFAREMPALLEENETETAQWYAVLGQAALREVFDTAFGLPDAFAQVDLDQQVAELQARSEALFGSSDLSMFTEPETQEKLMQRYFLLEQLKAETSLSSGQIASMLLSGGGFA